MKFYFGTTNQYKVRELAAILRPLGIELAVTDPIDPEETGDTLEVNAKIKAVAYGRHVGNQLIHQLMTAHSCTAEDALNHLKLSQRWVISEDSGIMVPALGGLPGPWSARFDDCLLDGHRIVGHESSNRDRDEIDLANNLRVLELMKGIEQPHRAASFGICLMVADVEGRVLFKTTCESAGWLTEEMRGTQGFGYDPIFVSANSFGKTWSEIDPMRKNLFSHRRRALQEFTAWLANQIKLSDGE
jgi:XTP/dITP diphosphohydrolase